MFCGCINVVMVDQSAGEDARPRSVHGHASRVIARIPTHPETRDYCKQTAL